MIEYDDVYNLAIQYPKSYMMVILRDMTIANKISTDAQRYIFEYINSLDGSFINKYIEYVCGIYFNLNTPLPIRLQHIAVMSFECGDIGISVFKNFEKQNYQELLTPLITHFDSYVDRTMMIEYIRINKFIDTNDFMSVFDRLYNKQKLMNGHHS